VEGRGKIRLSEIERRFICQACGCRGAEVRPSWHMDNSPGGNVAALRNFGAFC
jgi:hypothetical protein